MKKSLNMMTAAASVAVGAMILGATSGLANSITLNYSSSANAYINFNGGNITFTPAINSFSITGSSGNGSAVGVTGEMTGLFSIANVNGNSANVNGTGTLTLNDGATPLTATLTWVDIVVQGTGGTLNDIGVANLSNIVYAGNNVDLKALATSSTGFDVLSFQFIPAVPLSDLATGNYQTSFSGSLTSNAPDGGLTISLLGGAFLAVAGLRRKLGR